MEKTAQPKRQFNSGLLGFLTRDARHFQIVYLGLFLAYGLVYLSWDADLLKYGLIFGGCMAAQAIGIRFKMTVSQHVKLILFLLALGGAYVFFQGSDLLNEYFGGIDSRWELLPAIAGSIVMGTAGIIALVQTRPDENFKNWSRLKSGMITALGLCLLFKANDPSTFLIAAGLAIFAKYAIRFNKKHMFNPANFGIIVAMLLTQDAWISPGQWGSSIILVYFFGAAALIVLLKVSRIDSTLAFLGAFMLCQYIRTCLYQQWPLDHFLHQFSSGTILLYAFFMITDPVTTPNSVKGRVIWGIILGLISFGMTNWFYIHTAPIWALFIVSPLTVVLDKVFKGERFQWIKSERWVAKNQIETAK